MNLRQAPSIRMKLIVAGVTLLCSGVLLLARLGTYALWDDEAITALTAKGVLATGDTSAVVGLNIIAFRGGLLLQDLKDRSTPPLQFYLVAPFLFALGDTALAARLPFAICGLVTIGLMLWWLHRDDSSTLTWILMGLAIIGNVSLFLFFRQARYYGLATLLAVAVAYSYAHNRSRTGLIVHALLSALLLAANYMTFAAVSVAMLVDHLVWGRKRRALRAWDWFALLVPQVIVGLVVLWIWNPLSIAADGKRPDSWIGWKLTLLWWNLRDLDACEFGVAVLALAAPVVAVFARRQLLARALVAVAVMILVVTFASPQAPSETMRADVRYLAFLIPLLIAIEVMVLIELARLSVVAAMLVAMVSFFSNVLHVAPLVQKDLKLRSTPWLYARELIRPLPDPFTPVTRWISANVKPGASVFVLPQHMAYPLMFHAPHVVYAWQLSDPPPRGLDNLPPIHYVRRVLPDYIILFAPAYFGYTIDMPNYRLVDRIDVFGKDTYRPELFWRMFEPPPSFDPQRYGILIYKRQLTGLDFRL